MFTRSAALYALASLLGVVQIVGCGSVDGIVGYQAADAPEVSANMSGADSSSPTTSMMEDAALPMDETMSASDAAQDSDGDLQSNDTDVAGDAAIDDSLLDGGDDPIDDCEDASCEI